MNEQMKKMLSEERKSVTPKAEIKLKLDQAFEAKHEQRILPIWINYPIPAWQMAACIVVLIVAGIALGKIKPQEKVITELAVADTVYVEKVLPGKTDTVFIEKKTVVVKEQQQTETVSLPEEAPATMHHPEMIQEMHISDFHNIQPGGSSIGEDSSAKDWMVRIM